MKAYGAPGSAFATPEAFLKGAAATSQGAAPVQDGAVTVAGRKLTVYRRRFPVNAPGPHGPLAPAMLGSEAFVILPASGKSFVVLSCARESPVPDIERASEKAWAAFLKSVKPAAKPKR